MNLGSWFLVLGSFFFRVYHLDAQSFWYDEGNSARIAERSLRLIVEGAAGDIHPPLYYIALAGWRALAGDSEFALRALSALCGVLTVLATFALGRTLAGVRVGWMAAFFVAVSPFAIYYSQEARMYAPLALCATTAAWALFSLLGRWDKASVGQWESKTIPLLNYPTVSLNNGNWARLLIYLIATVAGLYTQYAYPFAMIAQGLGMLLWYYSYTNSRKFDSVGQILRPLLWFAGVNGLAIAAYAPWLPIALRQVLGWSVTEQDYALGTALLDVARWLIVGRTLPLSESGWAMGIIGALATLGLFRRSHHAHKHAAIVAAFLLLVPITLLFGFKLYRDAYLKFLLVCVPPLAILAAMGFEGLRMKRRSIPNPQSLIPNLVFAVGLLILFLPSLRNLYWNVAYARDDYRGIARLVQRIAQPGDAVLFNAPNQWEVFTYYHKPEREIAPPIALTYRPESEASINAEVQQLYARYKRVFVLYFAERESDPNGWYEKALALQGNKAGDEWIGNIRLAVYAQPPTQFGSTSVSATLGATGQITLDAIQLDPAPRKAGEVLPITLLWHTTQPIASNYKVFVHIGPVDGPPLAQNDAEPAAGYRPTTQWARNQSIVDPRAVWLRPSIAPGEYAILIGMYDAATGQRLPIRSSLPVFDNRLVVGKVVVTKP